ncbi:uncharacterized protein ACNLHF_005914 [Anomaloglossus baeobatrachus]|uniref:uncharacterized protein LOC142271956 n=1 Tax=Anomaloglossus baeobatrachus TaxID=238106 RepID=UPI003F5044D9
MARLLLALLTVFLGSSGLVTAEDPILVHGQLDSDLLLPVHEACTYNGNNYRFDLLRGTELIGAYDGELEGRKNYKGRLIYNTNCTITLRGLRTQNGTTFTVRLYFSMNDKSITKKIEYRVIISDPPTARPSTPAMTHPHDDHTSRNGTQVLSYGTQVLSYGTQVLSYGILIFSFVSFCLSLDSPVNIAFGFLLLKLQGSRYKLEEGKVKVTGLINYIITVLSEICSIGTLYSGTSYSLFLLPIPIILFIDILRSREYPDWLKDSLISFFSNRLFCGRCSNVDPSPRCQRIIGCLWSGFMLVIQVLFAVIVGGLCYSTGGFSGMKSSWIGYLFLSLVVSIILRFGVLGLTCCCYKIKFEKVPKEDPQKTPDEGIEENPKKTPDDSENESPV